MHLNHLLLTVLLSLSLIQMTPVHSLLTSIPDLYLGSFYLTQIGSVYGQAMGLLMLRPLAAMTLPSPGDKN